MSRRIQIMHADGAGWDNYLDAIGIPYYSNDHDLVLNKPKSYMFTKIGDDVVLVVWTGPKPTKKQIQNAMYFSCDNCDKELKMDKLVYVDGCGWFCPKCAKEGALS